MGSRRCVIDGIDVTEKQYDILSALRKAHEAERSLVALPCETGYDRRTLKIMQERDWIIESRKVFVGERRFMITGRGLALLKRIDARNAADTTLCPKCRQNPRYVSPKGNRGAYCKDCQNAKMRAQYAKNQNRYNPDLPCARCKSAPRARSGDGTVRTVYCLACRREVDKKSKETQYLRNQQVVSAGTAPLCSQCGLHPVYITARTRSSLCRACHNAYKRRIYRRHVVNRMAARLGRRA